MKPYGRIIALAALAATAAAPSHATQAYGSLNNFDVVNDTEHECHGFEIELEDVHTRDITYTYDWNHYGAPHIEEDSSDPLHPIVRVRYEATKNPDGSWSAYTAIPAGPVQPTDGHQFVDPSVNFGGEHFGVGFYGVPGTVRYFWLFDDGSGNLVRGNPIDIATPTFVYYPPQGGNPGEVAAAIVPPEPPELPVREFGEATWVKVTRTESHNNGRVELADLVSDDPEDDNDDNWRNGEPDEIEIEWQLLQTEFNQVDGGNNGVIENAPQELPDGDEVITVRYDFFEYSGPHDPESYEALCEDVGADGIHGDGTGEDEGGNVIDYSSIEVVGGYIGAQMAGFDVAGQIGLIDHVQDGSVGEPYIERRIVIDGTAPIVTTLEGALPEGMDFDSVEGILTGTPLVAGTFPFTVHTTDAAGGDLTTNYTLQIIGDPEGALEGEGVLEGEGSVEGIVEGQSEGLIEGEGSVEGAIEGSVEGIVEGQVEGVLEGEGSIEGALEGEGSVEGSVEGVVEGALEGEGAIEGSIDGEGILEGEGSVEGSVEGVLEGEGADDDIGSLLDSFAELELDDDHTLDIAEAQSLLPGITPEQFAALDTNSDDELNIAELLAGAGANGHVHSADTNGDKTLTLPELLRVIQLYNADGYACLAQAGDSEDGYTPGAGDPLACSLLHAADYIDGGNGSIELSELLRTIQFFSIGHYTWCPEQATDDGFCSN